MKMLNQHYREKFGCKVYKLSLDGGFTCPNRDGTLSTGGCIFCSASGGGSFAEKDCGSIEAQLEKAKIRVESKNKYGKYIQYKSTKIPICFIKTIAKTTIARKDYR